MSEIELSAEGTTLTVDEFVKRTELLPRKMELVDGKVYLSNEHRVAMLGFLLENLGVDMAIEIGDVQVWRDAIVRRDSTGS